MLEKHLRCHVLKYNKWKIIKHTPTLLAKDKASNIVGKG